MITLNKKYRVRDGRYARIICTDAPGVQPVIGFVGDDENVYRWDSTGQYFKDCNTSQYDLVEVSEYDDFKVGDQIFVRDAGCTWVRGYFAGLTPSGRPTTFKNGQTAWSSRGETFAWYEGIKQSLKD